MIRMTLRTDTVSPDLRRRMAQVKRPVRIYQAGAKAVQKFLSSHLRKLQARGNKKGWPSQHFFFGGPNSVEKNVGITQMTDYGAVIQIADPRFEHRIKGGTVTPKRNRFLAIPLTSEASRFAGQGTLRESAPWLKLIVTKKGAYLGKRDKARVIIMFRLLASVTHRPHPDEAPDKSQMERAAATAMQQAVDLLLRIQK